MVLRCRFAVDFASKTMIIARRGTSISLRSFGCAAETLVWWDVDSAPLPSDGISSLRIHQVLSSAGYQGPITLFAYGDLQKMIDSITDKGKAKSILKHFLHENDHYRPSVFTHVPAELGVELKSVEGESEDKRESENEGYSAEAKWAWNWAVTSRLPLSSRRPNIDSSSGNLSLVSENYSYYISCK